MEAAKTKRLRFWILALSISVAMGYFGAKAIYSNSNPPQQEIEAYRAQRQQEDSGDRSAYLARLGLTRTADSLNELMRSQITASKRPSDQLSRLREHSEFLSWLLAIHGFTSDKVRTAESNGFDVVAAALDRDGLSSRVVMSELVAMGEVVDVYDSTDSEDGYHSSIDVQVIDVLKGNAPGDVLTIRQEGGPLGDGRRVSSSTDLRPSSGDKYIFFLSNTLYRFHVLYPDDEETIDPNKVLAEDVARSRFIRVYTEIEVEDNSVVSANLARNTLEAVYTEIRSTLRLLEAAK